MLPSVLHNFIGTKYFVSYINNIILTVFKNICPLNSFSFLNFMITKNIKLKSNILNIKIMYLWILQVHSIQCDASSVATTPTSFICCKARLVTKVLSFMCSHSTEVANIVTGIKIIAVTKWCAFLANQKFSFPLEFGEQSLLMSYVLLEI